MEHRTGDRKAVSLDAVVGCPRFGLIRGRITDMCLGGLYIKAETSIVPIGAEVSVTFQPGGEVGNGCLTVMGRVAHQSLHGFGIVLDGLEAPCQEIMTRLLLSKPAVSQRAMPVLRAG